MKRKYNRVDIVIHLGRNDADLISWFNLLERSKQDKKKWIEAILLAIGTSSPIGTGAVIPITITPRQYVKKNKVMLFDNFMKEKKPEAVEALKNKYTSTYRDENNDYTVGSAITYHSSDPAIKEVVRVLRNEGKSVMKEIKQKIRDGFESKDYYYPPDDRMLDNFITAKKDEIFLVDLD